MRSFALISFALVFAACGGEDDASPPSASECDKLKGESVPSNSGDIFKDLACEGYASFAVESAAHASAGPHSTSVRTYINAALKVSLDASNAEHPAGAASVKVFLESNGTTAKGWAAMVKTQATSAGGDGWYWYENFSVTANSPIQGQGNTTCTGCHGNGGRDFFRSPYPLQ